MAPMRALYRRAVSSRPTPPCPVSCGPGTRSSAWTRQRDCRQIPARECQLVRQAGQELHDLPEQVAAPRANSVSAFHKRVCSTEDMSTVLLPDELWATIRPLLPTEPPNSEDRPASPRALRRPPACLCSRRAARLAGTAGVPHLHSLARAPPGPSVNRSRRWRGNTACPTSACGESLALSIHPGAAPPASPNSGWRCPRLRPPLIVGTPRPPRDGDSVSRPACLPAPLDVTRYARRPAETLRPLARPAAGAALRSCTALSRPEEDPVPVRCVILATS